MSSILQFLALFRFYDWHFHTYSGIEQICALPVTLNTRLQFIIFLCLVSVVLMTSQLLSLSFLLFPICFCWCFAWLRSNSSPSPLYYSPFLDPVCFAQPLLGGELFSCPICPASASMLTPNSNARLRLQCPSLSIGFNALPNLECASFYPILCMPRPTICCSIQAFPQRPLPLHQTHERHSHSLLISSAVVRHRKFNFILCIIITQNLKKKNIP